MSAERFFDDLARALAEPMPRRRAARLLGVSLLATAVPGIRPARLFARPTQRTCDQGCGENVRACPRLVNLAPVWDFCCGSPAKRYACVGDLYAPKCQDTCGGPNDIPCPSTALDVDGCPKFLCCKRPMFIGCEDGDCIPNCNWPPTQENRRKVQCGTACCDGGCCDRIFTTKAAYCCSDEDAFKAPWKDMEVSMIFLAVAIALVAGVATGGLAAFLVGSAAAAGLWGGAAKIIGDDPPDPRYKELFRPSVPRVASVRPGDGISPAAASALNRLTENRLRSGAYALAWIRSIEKAQGAEKAGDRSWAKRHRTAAAAYAREAAATLGRDRSLSGVALRELKRGGFADTGATPGQARQWQQQVRRRGLPAEMTRVLRAAGVDEARIASFRTAVGRLDMRPIAGVGAFGNLTDPRLAAANTAAIKALRRAGRA